MHINTYIFRFPQDIEKREKWLGALCLKGMQVRKTAAVCSAHFQEEDYESEHSLRKLKKYAVPFVSTMSNKFIF